MTFIHGVFPQWGRSALIERTFASFMGLISQMLFGHSKYGQTLETTMETMAWKPSDSVSAITQSLLKPP
jgi:hypothetical protein